MYCWRQLGYDRLQMRTTRAFFAALEDDLPVLFVYIGWANTYDGTEAITGRHGYLKEHPRDNGEARAFLEENGRYHCVIGFGQSLTPVHVVFVAEAPGTWTKKIVGVYANAAVEYEEGTWARAQTDTAFLIPVAMRPELSAEWPGSQGMRRWAKRDNGASHPKLFQEFGRLKSMLPRIAIKKVAPDRTFDQTFAGMEAQEGAVQRRLQTHRRREAKLRIAKIQQALKSGGGRLVCEVPKCGFDFFKRYGPLGYGYAHVHHLLPLASAGARGTKTTLDDLAVVCANCHAMIHKDGENRDLADLIPE